MEWPAVVTAISTAAIAILIALPMFASLPLLRDARRVVGSLQRLTETLNTHASPALQSARSAVDEAKRMVETVRMEVEGVAGTSRDLRTRVTEVADDAGERLQEVGALLEILQEEVEETVLDVAAALRTTRRSTSVLGAMKRALLGRRR